VKKGQQGTLEGDGVFEALYIKEGVIEEEPELGRGGKGIGLGLLGSKKFQRKLVIMAKQLRSLRGGEFKKKRPGEGGWRKKAARRRVWTKEERVEWEGSSGNKGAKPIE